MMMETSGGRNKRKHASTAANTSDGGIDVSTCSHKAKLGDNVRQALLLQHLSRVARKRPRIESAPKTLIVKEPPLAALKRLSPRAGDTGNMQLPPEVMMNIFNNLDAKDVCAAMRVCSGWYPVANDEQLWHTLCLRTFGINWTEEQIKNNQYHWKEYFKDLKKRQHDLELSYYVDGDGKPILEDGEKVFGCRHYRRNNKMFAECCKRFFVCRHCHNESQDHEINRYSVKTMYCMFCKTIQPISGTCKSPNCNGKSIAAYFCACCNFHDDTPNKEIYHCPKCNVCYCGKGLGQDYFHCDECNLCFLLHFKDTHKHIFQKKPDAH